MADSAKNAKKWSAKQLKFQEWLATPRYERVPPTQQLLAQELGVNHTTLSRWKAQDGFMDAVIALSETLLQNDLPEIYGALAREAKQGSFQHIKLALELTGRYVERQEVTGANGNEIVLRVVYGNRNADDADDTAS